MGTNQRVNCGLVSIIKKLFFMQSAPIDLRRVRHLFSKPDQLKASDAIYREIASRMHERLQLVRLSPKAVVDAGCGAGADLSVLHNTYPEAQLIGVDASENALRRTLREQNAASVFMQRLFSRLSGKVGNADLICADFGQIPLPALATDLVWSNMALHWHSEPDLVFKEWLRILRVHGLLMFSCFGPDSLKEIRTAFEEADQAPHTLPFVDMHDFGDMLVNAGFATPVMDMEVITFTYTSVTQLMSEVRALGGNPLTTRKQGLMGRAAWQRVCERLERMRRDDGRIPLTMEIIYGHAFKPEARRNRPGESIIKFDILKK
jgi:malonyl-CoA O-methyltransferase